MKEATAKEELLLNELEKKLQDFHAPDNHLERRNLLRFLRARNHSVDNAATMFKKNIQWREEKGIDSICTWKHSPEYDSYWPWEFGGVDIMGGPIIVLPLGLWNPSAVTGNYDQFIKYGVKGIEMAWRQILHLGRGQNVHQQFSAIFDVKELGFKHLTSIEAMKGTLELVRTFEANYPESLRIGILINAPYMFGMIWRLIKPMVSPDTYSKLRFIGTCDKKRLKTEILKHMDVDQFPVMYGGTAQVPTTKGDLTDFSYFAPVMEEPVKTSKGRD